MKTRTLILSLLFTAGVTAQQQQPPKPPSVEERLKHVSEKLNKEMTLTAAQKTKVEAAYKEFFADIEKLRAKNGKKDMPPPPPPPPGSKEEMDKLVQARDAKIKTALSDAQFKKYVEVEKTMRPPHPGEGPGGKQGPPPPDKKQ